MKTVSWCRGKPLVASAIVSFVAVVVGEATIGGGFGRALPVFSRSKTRARGLYQ
jgi:hypothetical protein